MDPLLLAYVMLVASALQPTDVPVFNSDSFCRDFSQTADYVATAFFGTNRTDLALSFGKHFNAMCELNIELIVGHINNATNSCREFSSPFINIVSDFVDDLTIAGISTPNRNTMDMMMKSAKPYVVEVCEQVLSAIDSANNTSASE